MGKKKNKEKTAKTAKKSRQIMKKELQALGEDEVEQIIAHFHMEDKKRQEVNEKLTSPPSARSNITLTAHPEKEELILFGGQYFNGRTTFMYNDLYFYNIKKNEWTLIQAPNAPPPRCSHQAVIVHQCGGQLWIFGGEFASPSQNQFYHYKDLWVFHLQQKKWEEIKSPGPSARSGHRMIAFKKNILLFGGFHDNIRDYNYFNDVHIFSLETYNWVKIEPSGIGPSPRSGCQLITTPEGGFLVYGGYCKERVKKDVEKGNIFTDMFILSQDDKKESKWKWSQVKQAGKKPLPRCSSSMINISPNYAMMFGGVYDELENEENIESVFFNDLYRLDLNRRYWYQVELQGKKREKAQSRRKKKMKVGNSDQRIEPESESSEEETEITDQLDKKLQIGENKSQSIVVNDGIFTVSIASQPQEKKSSTNVISDVNVFNPSKRMNCNLAFKNGVLYLYGGLYEEGNRVFTLTDLYSLDTHKMDEWKVIIEMTSNSQEWIDSSESSSSDDDDDSEEGACGGCDDEEVDSDD